MLCMSSVERTLTLTFLRPTEQASKLERTGTGMGTLTGTLTLTLTLTGTVIFEGSTVNNINNKWRGIEEVERGCFGGGLFELTRWIK